MAPGGSAPASAAADARLYVGANTSVGEAGGLITSRDQRRQSCVPDPPDAAAPLLKFLDAGFGSVSKRAFVRSHQTRADWTGTGSTGSTRTETRVRLGPGPVLVFRPRWPDPALGCRKADKRSCPEKHGGKRWRLRLSRLFSRPALLLSGVRSSPTVNLVLRGRGTGWR